MCCQEQEAEKNLLKLLWSKILKEIEYKISKWRKKKIIIAVDYENVKLTLRNKSTVGKWLEPDWAKLIEICSARGEIIIKKIFAPMLIREAGLERVYEFGFEISLSPAGKEGKDLGQADRNLNDKIRRDIINTNPDVLFVVADDKDHIDLLNFARDRGIEVIIVEIENAHSSIKELGVQIIKMPVKGEDISELPAVS